MSELNQYKNKAIVYGLIDPRDNSIRYIGKSIQGISRARQHKCPSSLKEGNTPKNNWIKKLQGLGLEYQIVVLFSVDKKTQPKEELNLIIYNKEQEFINQFKDSGRLLNLQDGGPGSPGRSVTDKQRQKMSENGTIVAKKYLQKYNDARKLDPEELRRRKQAYGKLRDRSIPGAKFKYYTSKGKKILAKDSSGNELMGFYAARIAAKFLGGKASHTGITKSILNKTIYYGYYWEYI